MFLQKVQLCKHLKGFKIIYNYKKMVNKLYNSIKICNDCNWYKKFDSNRDIFRIANKEICPVCESNNLVMRKYNPDL